MGKIWSLVTLPPRIRWFFLDQGLPLSQLWGVSSASLCKERNLLDQVKNCRFFGPLLVGFCLGNGGISYKFATTATSSREFLQVQRELATSRIF